MALFGFLVVAGCSNDNGATVNDGGDNDGGDDGSVVVRKTPPELCDELSSPPVGCGTSTCSGDSDCATGMFCLDSLCTAICTPTEGCESDEVCTAQGRCEEQVPDGGVVDSGGCDPTSVTPTRIVPNVMFIVDQSGSMTFGFPGGGTRWEAAHDAISAVVDQSSSIVRFGLTTYTYRSYVRPYTCPQVVQANVSFDLMSIEDSWAPFPRTYPGGGDTPTGESIGKVVEILNATSLPADGPTILVLATDGDPDTCAQPNPNEGQALSIAAVQAAQVQGYDTFILSVGSDVAQSHLDEMANAGVGLPTNTNPPATSWVGNSPAELAAHFGKIVTDQIPCDVVLNKHVAAGADICDGTVTMDSTELTCGVDYRLKPGTTNVLELLGTDPGGACHTWITSGSALDAVFQCGVIVE